jgi:Tol biopolymer transport system component/predicted Ser/Thr protein kinase
MTPRTLSHYEIREELSRGGMGIVYRALDVKLEREVALKILLPDLVKNEVRKRRFIQEAKAAAALKHPNIAVIYEIDDAEDETFIAMELIEGWKLSDLLAKERLSISRAAAMAVEILEGLSSAHEKGIVHRDLKPANLMVTKDGHIKIIDFGLAKLVERVPSVNDADSDAQTKLKGDTQEGQVLGTVAYMSPEQARGQSVDNRTDLFSFGIVFYEMLTGETPFQGSSAVETMSAIINQSAPPVSRSVKGSLAEALSRIVERCLEKDPEDRYQTAKDLLSEVRRVKRDSESGARVADVAAAPGRRRVLGWALLGLVAFAVVVFSLVRWASGPTSLPRFTHPIQVTSAVGVEDHPSWSPDGQTLAYQSNQAGNWDIWMTQVGSGQHLNRTKDHEGDDLNPSWSPDGREIAFISNRDGWGAYVMSALTGSPRKVAALGRVSPQWSSDGTQLAYLLPVTGEGWQAEVLSPASGESKRLPLPGSGSYRWGLTWSADSRFLAYVDGPSRDPQITQLWLLRASSGEAIPITNGKWKDESPSWSKDGKYLYFVSNRGGAMDLWRQEIGDGVVIGEPEPLTAGVGMRTAFLSPDGTKLAYSRGRLVGNLWRVPIRDDSPATWGDAQQLTFDEAHVEYADVSTDGTRLVLSSDRAGNPDLWLMPAGGGEMHQLTTDPTPDWAPTFSPDGSQIAFYAYRSGNRDLWVMPASGGQAKQVTRNPAQDFHPSWSPDGTSLAFRSVRDGNMDVYAIAIDGSGEKRLTEDPAPDASPAISPDGAWIVFWSRRDGSGAVWRMPREGGESLRLTPGDGSNPIWSRDGRAVYFLDRNDLWTVPTEGGEVRKLTDFSGKRGSASTDCLATDERFLYFTWLEDAGDIWVMDVVYE